MADKRLNEDTELRRNILYKVLSNSVLQSRAAYGNTKTFGGLRDVYTALGYPAVDKIDYSDFYAKYKRQDIAAAIIDKPVFGAWKKRPVIRSKGKDAEDDEFKIAFDTLADEHRLFDVFQRVDKLAGIGQYAVMLVGVNDGGSSPEVEIGASSELLYIQPYGQDNAPIHNAVTDLSDRRFAMPDKYGIRSVKLSGGVVSSGEYTERLVHHSRVIHVADNILENNIYGHSRLENIYNRLLSLELIVGGSGEMFWQGAFPGLAFSLKQGATLTPQDASDLEDEIKSYVHNLERYMKLREMDVENLSGNVADPTSHVDVNIRMICTAKNIPKRILEGSERGELASSQDTKAWHEYLDNRRRTFCEPSIVRPTVDKFIEVGLLPEPVDGYTVEWPDLEATSDKDKAEVGKIRAEAIGSYSSSPESQMIIPPREFLEEILDLDPEKVARITEAFESGYGETVGIENEGYDLEDIDDDLLEDEWKAANI